MTSRSRAALTLSLSLVCALASRSAAQTPCGGTSGPDVIVGDITGPANYSANSGFEALSLGSTSCNQGTAPVGWHANTNQHPVIGGELYRFKVVDGSGRFEMIGRSWLKHGFFAESQHLCCPNCTATDGTILGVGCSDPYTAGRNGTQSLLGPRFQVNANTGFFVYPPPHPSGGNLGRIEVDINNLEVSSPSGTRYFGNCEYIAPDDALARHGNNNCSYREVTVTGSGTTWTFGFSGSTVREVPAILAWNNCEPGVNTKSIQLPNEGLLLLDWKVTPLGGGMYHYEYALFNMNSHDSVRSFSLPLAPGVVLTNVGFHDVGYRGNDGEGGVQYDGTDWTPTNNGTTFSWSTSTFAQNPNANALRWATTFNFRFDANAAPVQGDVTLGLFRSGGSASALVEIPNAGTPIDTDGDGIPDNQDNCPLVPNPNQANADGDSAGDACDGCPVDPNKIDPGVCGCGIADADLDADGVMDCVDNCPSIANPGQEDCDGNAIGDVCDLAQGAPDCNMNGIIDSCDISGGTSLDANQDGVPDECQQSGGIAYCFGDGTGADCPCGNLGGPGHGCANSDVGSVGALLSSAGHTQPDSIVLTSTGEKAAALSVFLQGDVRLPAAVAFGDGLRCAGGNLKRIAVLGAAGGAVSYPHAGDPSISARSAALGDPLSPGTIRSYQVYYRDPSATFCPAPAGGTFNATQAVQLVW
jgi:hypothetical protein